MLFAPIPFRTVVVVVCLSLAVILLGPSGTPRAAGAPYEVYGCRTPSGGVAPTSGWSSVTNLPSGFGGTTDSCPQGGGMQAYLQGDIAHGVGEYAQWAFHPPVGLRLIGATLWRTGSAAGSATNATAQVYLAAPESGFASVNVFAQCTVAFGCTSVGDGTFQRTAANAVVVPPQFVRDDGGIFAVAGCGGSAGAACPATGPGNKAVIAVGASEITLDDPAPPTINATTGTLTVGGVLGGTVNTTVQASDVGSGVFALGLNVDEKSVAVARFPDSTGRCTPVPDSDGRPGFLWTVPCPPNGAAALQVDTRTISDGPHQVTLYVQDAAGNRSAVGSATTMIKNTGGIGPGDPVSLRGDPNGSPVTDQGRLSAAFLRHIPKRCSGKHYRHRHPKRCNRRVLLITRNYSGKATDRVSGRLRTADGAPIVGARISLVRVPRHGGGAPREVASARTGVTGRWETRVRRRMSAGVRVQWMARVKDTIPVAMVRVSERVRARSSLRLTPKRLIRHGHTLKLRGMLLGRSGVKKGVAIAVQANAGHRWRAVTTVRARRSGGWSARYRIPRQLYGRYRFRILVKPGASYPYQSGKSRTVHLRVH